MEQHNIDGGIFQHDKNHLENYQARPSLILANFVKKPFFVKVGAPDTTYSVTFELDKSIAFIRGIMLSSNRDDLMYYRGSQKIEINRLEVCPEDYDSKHFMSSINCSPNVRYYDTGRLPAGNGLIKIEYKDTSDTRAPFEVYRVTLNVDCELKQ